MDSYIEIKNKIRSMVGQNSPLLLTAKVESVDANNGTCVVSVGSLRLTDVRLRSVINTNASKLLITPAKGSYVTIIDLSGELRATEVIGYSEIETLDIETSNDINIRCNGTITFNEGDNHGIVKVEKVAEKIQALENDINKLKQAFSLWMPVVYDGGAALKAAATAWAEKTIQPTTKYSDLENDKIKH